MLVREVLPEEKDQFNAAVNHPLQSWEWGQFREKSGIKVIRLGVFDPKQPKKLINGYQLTLHQVPYTGYTIIYFPRGPFPDKTMINALIKLSGNEKAILVKMAPNVCLPVTDDQQTNPFQKIHDFLINNRCQKTKPFWFEYSYHLDLTQSESQLLASMHPKARYNISLSQRHGVIAAEDNSPAAFDLYLKMMMETTRRQKFYAHTPQYHRQMWKVLQPAGIAHLLVARYQERILAAWMLFKFKDVLHYPYGASSRESKEVMPAYALTWEAIRFGQKLKCRTFDLWGCLGPNPDPKDPWFGFHRFKAGFGGQMVKYLGSYDLVADYQIYPFYNFANNLRWKLLKLKSKIALT